MSIVSEPAGKIEAKESFSPADLALLDSAKIPRHIAIIMDGNRRWARKKGLPLMMGHWEGAEGLTDIVRAASELGVKTLTVFAFSTENWQRSEEEIQELMHLFHIYLMKKKDLMVQEGIALHTIGDLSKLPANVLQTLQETKEFTRHGSKINLVLAVNYGARDEIKRAMGKILEEQAQKKLTAQDLTEELIARHLDTSAFGDPDLLIRTSGEHRVSNFLLWQISYAEIYISNVLWPEFHPKELLQAVLAYQSRIRRLGT